MLSIKVNQWPLGHDQGRIDTVMAAIVMSLDIVDIHGFRYAGLLIQVPDITPETWVVYYASQVTFEMADINRIKTHKRSKQTPVCFGYLLPR